MPVAPAPVAAPAPEAAAPAPDCAAVAAERTELQGLQAQVKRSISDLAFNRPTKRRKVGAADVGRAAAGTAASVLLPFGVGFLLSAATGAATRKRRGPPEPQADVPALIDRQLAIEARLRELAATPCAAAALPAAPSSQLRAAGQGAERIRLRRALKAPTPVDERARDLFVRPDAHSSLEGTVL